MIDLTRYDLKVLVHDTTALRHEGGYKVHRRGKYRGVNERIDDEWDALYRKVKELQQSVEDMPLGEVTPVAFSIKEYDKLIEALEVSSKDVKKEIDEFKRILSIITDKGTWEGAATLKTGGTEAPVTTVEGICDVAFTGEKKPRRPKNRQVVEALIEELDNRHELRIEFGVSVAVFNDGVTFVVGQKPTPSNGFDPSCLDNDYHENGLGGVVFSYDARQKLLKELRRVVRLSDQVQVLSASFNHHG